jgi:hypothetical protein
MPQRKTFIETGAMASPEKVDGRRHKAVCVRMLRFNMSGRRAGTVLTLPTSQASDWIARGWAEQIDARADL